MKKKTGDTPSATLIYLQFITKLFNYHMDTL